jgi:Bacterial Ig-like domain
MPTGGEKDVKPPVLLSAVPENYQVNFSAGKIVLTFNEYVQLKDVQKQVMISPPMNPAPQIELRKKSVIITIMDSLKSNTTYTMNFGNALVDFTEGNPMAGFQYVFSTGSEMDSLVIAGIMKDAITLKPLKEALALIYDSGTADTSIGKVPPLYYARTNEAGVFKVHNVRKGSYRLVGLDDKNSNFTADFADEAIGVGTDILLLTDSAFMTAYLSIQPPAKQAVKSSKLEAPGKLVTVFARPVINPTWNFIGDQPGKVIPEFSAYRDTVILYCSTGPADSMQIVWTENMTVDTVLYRAEKQKVSGKTIAAPKALGISYPQNGGTLYPETAPSIIWSAPLQSFDFSQVKAIKDSSDFPVAASFKDSVQAKTIFEGDWKEGTYEIIIPSGSAQDFYGRSNDSIRFAFSVAGDQKVGSISFVFIAWTTDNVLLQLVNDKDEKVRQRNVNGKLKGLFEHVDPGLYRLRIVYDVNKNGRWDAGDIRNNIPPEKVSYYKDPITVRANWEVEVEWAE